MTIEMRLTIALHPDVQALLQQTLNPVRQVTPGLPPSHEGPAEPVLTNGTAPPPAKRGRGRPPKATAPEPEPVVEEPDPEPDPLADFAYPLTTDTVRKLMMLLASQHDKDEAVRTMSELAATADKSFTFTNVSSIPPAEIPYMIEGLVSVVDLNAKDRQGHRLLGGEIDATEILQP